MRRGAYVLGYKGIYFIAALFLLTFIFLYMKTAFTDYQTERVQCPDVVLEEIMIAKVLYSSCVAYEDPETERVLPATIDKEKFTQENLETCFFSITKGMSLVLEGTTIGDEIEEKKTIKKLVWVYENEDKHLTIIDFIFEEPSC